MTTLVLRNKTTTLKGLPLFLRQPFLQSEDFSLLGFMELDIHKSIYQRGGGPKDYYYQTFFVLSKVKLN